MQNKKPADIQKTKDYLKGGAIGFVIAFILSVAFYDLDKVSVWLLVLILPGARIYEKMLSDRRRDRMLTEFRDGLSYVKNALDAGDSAEHAFGAAVLPLKKLYGEGAGITKDFAEICRKVQNGKPLESAIAEFADKTGIPDIQDFGAIFPVLKRTGGDMNLFLSHQVRIISDKQSLKRELNAVTAARKSEFYIMCLIPTAMILYLKIFSADMMAGLYHEAGGQVFMTLMLVLYAICILGGQWILKRHLG